MNRVDAGRRIARYRIKKGISTQQLAESVKRSQATISRIENGKQGINLELLYLIAQKIGVSPFALLTDDPLEHPTPVPMETAQSQVPHPRFLAFQMQEARQKRHRSAEVAAAELGISEDELSEIEGGTVLPNDEMLKRMGVYYGIDSGDMASMSMMERVAPALSERLAILHGIVQHLVESLKPFTDGSLALKQLERMRLLKSRWDGNARRVRNLTERQGVYFSIGHLSDRLLEALQNPAFHVRVEEMAREFLEKPSLTGDSAVVDTEASGIARAPADGGDAVDEVEEDIAAE